MGQQLSTEQDADARLQRGLELLWEGHRSPRGGKPRLSLERIVEAGIRLADSEGLDGLSMRRVASELGSGAMSLYRYMPGKEELIDLMVDAVTGQTPFPDPPPEGWRARLEWSARADWALYREHLWSLQALATTRPPLGPNVLAATDWALAAVDGLGLSVQKMSWIVMLVSGYVQGAALLLVNDANAQRRSGSTREEWWAARSSKVMELIQADAFPTLTRVVAENTAENDLNAWFEFGLTRLLDGIAVFIDTQTQAGRHGEAPPPGR
jgi:AcrR family transcriptional regulator